MAAAAAMEAQKQLPHHNLYCIKFHMDGIKFQS